MAISRRLARLLAMAIGLGIANLAPPAQAQTLVALPSQDRVAGQAVVLPGHWFASGRPGQRPAVLMLHGCSGALDPQGRLYARWLTTADSLIQQGWHVLVLDSFTPRGRRQICTQKVGERAITQLHRRLDALGALQWLAQQPGVDVQRLALIGWSNGGSTVLSATNLRHPAVAGASLRPRAAVAYYPGCETELKRGYVAQTALMLQVGADDDWTPAAPCQALVAQAAGGEASGQTAVPPPVITVHADAFHGFDGEGPVRLRLDVPNGSHPGQGVHVGGQPAARTRSQAEVLAFLQKHLAD